MKAADKGDMQSQVNVANAYYLGNGTGQDHHKAFLWYREAAFQGHILSQKNVGAAYWNGDGVEKNLEECVFWYELAANGGDAQAQFATGWFLMTGTGVPKDERKGLKWIHKATFQGFQPAIDYCKEHGYKKLPETMWRRSRLWVRASSSARAVWDAKNWGVASSRTMRTTS